MKQLKWHKDLENWFLLGNHVRLAIFLCCVQAPCISFGQALANDNFSNPIPLYGNSVVFTSTTANATFEPGLSRVKTLSR